MYTSEGTNRATIGKGRQMYLSKFWSVGLSATALCMSISLCAAQMPHGNFVKVTSKAAEKAVAYKPIKLIFHIKVDSPFHIQGHPSMEGYIPTNLKISAPKGIKVLKITYPKPVVKPFFGEKLPVYEGEVNVTALLEASKTGTFKLPYLLHYQGCNTQQCYPPQDAKGVAVVNVKGSGAVSHEKHR